MDPLTWFQLDDYVVGIDLTLTGIAIADCLSAGFNIPLKTGAMYDREKRLLYVGYLTFIEIERPVNANQLDKIF